MMKRTVTKIGNRNTWMTRRHVWRIQCNHSTPSKAMVPAALSFIKLEAIRDLWIAILGRTEWKTKWKKNETSCSRPSRDLTTAVWNIRPRALRNWAPWWLVSIALGGAPLDHTQFSEPAMTHQMTPKATKVGLFPLMWLYPSQMLKINWCSGAIAVGCVFFSVCCRHACCRDWRMEVFFPTTLQWLVCAYSSGRGCCIIS